MATFILIKYPVSSTSLMIRYDTDFCDVSRNLLIDHFDLQLIDFDVLHIYTKEDVSVCIPPVVLDDGEAGYRLDGRIHSNFEIVAKALHVEPSSIKDDKDETIDLSNTISILSFIRRLPFTDNLHLALVKAIRIVQVLELPSTYDGDIVFELPPAPMGSPMAGMDRKFDGHVWTEYKTCTKDNFMGVVRLSRCAGHLSCSSLDCPFLERNQMVNEKQWKGRIKNIPSTGIVTEEDGSLCCKHCNQQPVCLKPCEATIYYCYPFERKMTTRCVIHQGCHDHPVEQGLCRATVDNMESMVVNQVRLTPNSSPKQIEINVAQEVIKRMLAEEGESHVAVLQTPELQKVLDTVTPLSDRRRLQRCVQMAKKDQIGGVGGLEALLDLKRRCRYPFFHSVLFPGQLEDAGQPHVFKMSTMGPGSGIELINRMRPDGNLRKQWVHFDHIHRVQGWTTMSAHVYDPYIRELQTIATCEFKVENTNAQVQFWRMLNAQLLKHGYQEAEFAGFMADEASANWLALRTVFNNGPNNVMEGKERSCAFHWEQSMLFHTKRCIHPPYHEEHKMLCHKWKNAASVSIAEYCRKELHAWWRADHAKTYEIPTLDTWLAWWDVRGNHWGNWFLQQIDGGGFVPNVNLSENKHSSMRAAQGCVRQVSLYEASAADLAMAVLQNAHCNAYLSWKHVGTGPSLQKLRDRFLSRNASSSMGKRLIDLTHEVVEEIGIPVADMEKGKSEERSIRMKRASSDPQVILETDSHRPDYSTVTRNVGVVRRNTNTTASVIPDLMESDVHETQWAIRRTPPKSSVTCFGYLSASKARCGALINPKGRQAIQGVPAPCFEGRRQHSNGIIRQVIWFCSTIVSHTWVVDKSIIGVPGHAPGVWKIARNTSISLTEASGLLSAGFVLEHEMSRDNLLQSAGIGPTINTSTPSHVRASRRDGKQVRWRTKLGKEFKERMGRAIVMEAELLLVDVIVKNEVHIFQVKSIDSVEGGVTYVVQISEFPRCSCADFMRRETGKDSYVPCKHIYFVFLKVLGLKSDVQKFMHQAALTKVELIEAFHLYGK